MTSRRAGSTQGWQLVKDVVRQVLDHYRDVREPPGFSRVTADYDCAQNVHHITVAVNDGRMVRVGWEPDDWRTFSECLYPSDSRSMDVLFRSIYSRRWEDHVMEYDERQLREQFDHAVWRGGTGYGIDAVMQARYVYERGVSRLMSHRAERVVNPPVVIDHGGFTPRAGTRTGRITGLANFSSVLGGGTGSAEARARGEALLRANLTPPQLASLEERNSFTVVGSDTGKRYLIKRGRQQNVFELDGRGRTVCGWCFLPSGGLVEGDIMLGQKIALECDERATIKIANRFKEFGWQPRNGSTDAILDW